MAISLVVGAAGTYFGIQYANAGMVSTPLTTSSNDSKVEKEELDKIKQAYELISSKYYKM